MRWRSYVTKTAEPRFEGVHDTTHVHSQPEASRLRMRQNELTGQDQFTLRHTVLSKTRS